MSEHREAEAAVWEEAADYLDGCARPSADFQWKGTLYCVGDNGAAALRNIAQQFRKRARRLRQSSRKAALKERSRVR